MPAATVAMFCSATPISMKRPGNSFWNHSARVDSVRSALKTTTRSSAFPASTAPLPKPSRVGAMSCLSNIFSVSFASGLVILLVFAGNLAAERTEFIQEFRGFFLRRRFAVPFVVEFDVVNTFAGDGVRDDDRRLLIDRFCLVTCRDELRDIVAVDFQDMPVERLIFLPQGFQRHDVFRHAVDLDVVTVDDGREVRESVLPREKDGFPEIPFLMLAVGHRAIDAEFPSVHPRGIGISRCL